MWQTILLSSLILTSVVCGQSGSSPIFSDVATNSSLGSFTSPNETHHAFHENEFMTMSLSTSLDAIIIILYQCGVPEGRPMTHRTTQNEGKELWNVTGIETGPDSPPEFSFRALDGLGQLAESNRSGEFWSPTFTILPPRKLADASAQGTGARFVSGSNSPSTSTGVLSPGLTIGLAASFTAGSVGIVVYLLYVSRKRGKIKATKSKLSFPKDLPELCTYEPVPHGSPASPAEMKVKPVEMEGTRAYAELPSESRPGELPNVQDLDELVIERHR